MKVDIENEVDEYLKDTLLAFKNIAGSKQLSDAISIICNCKGRIVTTGLGKAGHAAHKASSLFSSLGFPSQFLHPAEALHGDIGGLRAHDVIIAYSTSGKTREVLETLRLSKEIGVKTVIAVTSHEDALIREFADVELDMGVIKEAGYLGIAPTTSIIIMLMISDILATTAAKKKDFTLSDYAKRHHAGYLGGKARGDGEIY